MTRIPLLALSLALLASLPATAQAPAKQPDLANELLGVWEGPYQSEAAPPGSLKLSVAQGEQKEWKVTLEILSEQPPSYGEVRDFTVEAGVISWVQDVNEMQCRSVARLVAGVLKGDAECTQGGALAITASFLLEKKKP